MPLDDGYGGRLRDERMAAASGEGRRRAREHRAAKRGKGAALKQSRDKAVTARGKDQSDGNGSDGNGKHRVSRGSLPYAS